MFNTLPRGPKMTTTIRRDTKSWKTQVWISFGIAVTVCATGLGWLPGADLERAFMVMGYVFCLSAVFALSKFVRDKELSGNDTPMWSTSTRPTRPTCW